MKMVHVPQSDECPKCGKELVDCTCSAEDLDDENDSPEMTGTSSHVFPAMSSYAIQDRSTAIIEPRVGNANWVRRSPPRANDWVEIEDPERYNLPPLDQNLYDLKHPSRDRFEDPQLMSRSLSRSPSFSPVKSKSTLKRVMQTDGDKDESPGKQDYSNEEFYMRRGCWCKDCPWLIAYAIIFLFWLVVLGIIWERKGFVGGPRITIKDTRCEIVCTQLRSPTTPLEETKTSSDTFHCMPGVEKWETYIFKPWVIMVEEDRNHNCVDDCDLFKSVEDFLPSCVKTEGPVGAIDLSKWDSFFNPANSVVYVESIREHWYWIVHVIVITNAISLFILLVPLFFCCPMVAFFVIASVTASLILMVMLCAFPRTKNDLSALILTTLTEIQGPVLNAMTVLSYSKGKELALFRRITPAMFDPWDVARFLGKAETAGLGTTPSTIAKWTYTIGSTVFTGYIIFNAFIVFKRFRITCTVAGLSSRVVNAVPMILLEAVLISSCSRFSVFFELAASIGEVDNGVHLIFRTCTMVLLFLLIAVIIFASVGVEAANPLYVRGSRYYFSSSPLTWFARALTLIVGYWTAQLLINCQTIIVHGALTRYYFEKNKKNRVLTSHKRLLKYHICTACFSGLLFNWFYWILWFYKKSRIRSRSLFGTGAFGLCFCPASKVVKQLIFQDPSIAKRIDKANPYFFLVHMLVVVSIAIVTKLVFSGPYENAFWPHLLMTTYAYFVGLAAIDIYRVTKDAMYLCYLEDRTLSKDNPSRDMKMPHHILNFFAHDPRVSPR